jgi:hypothetical protein
MAPGVFAFNSFSAPPLCVPGKNRLTAVVQGYQDREMEISAPRSVDVLME